MSYKVLCVLFPLMVWYMPGGLFSVFNLSITPCERVAMWGCVDICTRASHFDFMTLLFPSPVVSGWFIQWQMQSLWTGLACNDLSCHWKRLERKVRGGGRRRENEDTKKTAREELGRAQPFSTYTGLIRALLTASVILLRHLQLRHIGKIWGTSQWKNKLRANLNRRETMAGHSMVCKDRQNEALYISLE